MEDKKFKISKIDSVSSMALILNELISGVKAKINSQGIFEELSRFFAEEHHEHLKKIIDKTDKKTLSSLYKSIKSLKTSILSYLEENCVVVNEDESKSFYIKPLDEKLEKEILRLETVITSALKKKESYSNNAKAEIKDEIANSRLFLAFLPKKTGK